MAAASSYFDQVQQIYTAFYQRPADPGGLLFWSQMAAVNGGDLSKVINAFATSAEATALYGAITTANVGDVVNSIYKVLFGRDADAAGKKFYVDGFAAGAFTAGKIALNILNGAQNSDLIAINNKTAAANVFTSAVDGRPMSDAGFGASGSFAATYSGNADVVAARAWLATVGSDPASVPSMGAVIGAIQANIANVGDAILNMQGNLTLAAPSALSAVDNLTGTAASDVFLARTVNNVNTLNDGDRINGGDGVDTLYADMVPNTAGVAITPIFTNLENVVIRAQAAAVDSINGNNMTGRPVQIDAQRSLGVSASDQVTAAAGVTRWESNNSRSDVIIEDVRIGNNQKTSDVTIAMVETDPGNVDYGVYFNQHSLRNASSGSSSISFQLMDTGSAAVAATAATPLLFNPYDKVQFFRKGVLVTLNLNPSTDNTQASKADTYADLLKLFQAALDRDSKLPLADQQLAGIKAEFGAKFQVTDPLSGVRVEGTSIRLTASADTPLAGVTSGSGGWVNSLDQPVPLTANIYNTVGTDATNVTELVTSKIILDDVGLGSTGGDLVVGGMSVGETSTSRGVERFEIEVRDNSKLQTINSTNNALREVTIVNGAISRTVADAYTNYLSGDLTVNGNVNLTSAGTGTPANTGNDTILKGVNNSNGINGYTADHHGAFGFTDVRLIDGSAMTGRLAFTAQITQDSIRKYIDLVDTQADPAADVAGSGNVNFNVKGANFIYTGGANADTLMVTIDGVTAGSRSTIVSGQSDFTFAINGGAGNDSIWVDVTNDLTRTNNGAPQNWYNNQDLNNNITIDGGTGDDVIRTPGSGDKNILGGAGNDWMYTDNTGMQVVAATTATAVSTNAGRGMWAYNTTDQTAGVTAANLAPRNINDVRSDVNNNNNFFNTTLTVNFKGIVTAVPVSVANSGYRTSDLQINQAIKSAINNDATLKALLVAKDGPANSLIVESLIDGVMATGDLTVTLTLPTSVGGGDVAAAAAAYGLPATATATDVMTAMTAARTTFMGKGDYNTVMASDGTTSVTGAASVATTDNLITPGTGNDIIVLSTTVGATTAASSNETIKFEPGFGDDVIVNFATAGMGVDHLDFVALNGVAVGGFATDKSIIVERPPVTSTGAIDEAAIAAKFNANGNTAAQKHVYIAVWPAAVSNMATVYTVEDPVGTTGATIAKQGTIKLAAADWLAPSVTVAGSSVFTNSGAAGYALVDGPSATGTVVATPTYAVAAGATSNNEGSNATFTVTTTNVANGTVLNYSLSGTGITAADVTGGVLTGTVTINNGTGTIAVALAADVTTEGNETLRLDLATTAGGTSMANASTTIADTSVASTFTNVDLSTGTVAGTAAAEAFVYDYKMVSGRPTKAGDGEVTITGFDVAKDKLVFNDTGTGTVFTKAQFFALAGVVVADDPFSGNATIYLDPDNGVSGGVTLTGVVTTAVPVETLA